VALSAAASRPAVTPEVVDLPGSGIGLGQQLIPNGRLTLEEHHCAVVYAALRQELVEGPDQ
jgi:hypothetical protein